MKKANRATLIGYYRTMVVIRRFEEAVEQLFARGVIRGTTHPSSGQEAVAVGSCAALGKNDYITSTHRGHGHFIARGADPRRIMAELFGKSSGYSHGRGGSQIMADFRLGFLGSNGITGSGLAIATGAGLAMKLQGRRSVVLCFFGDGAASQGTFHESLNMASLWKLPVIYLCENNLYAMSSPVAETVSVPHIAQRAEAYGMKGVIVDGNDVLAVRDAVAQSCFRARNGNGPELIECKTYRLSGHSRGDPRIYRTREEEALWHQRDPILRFRTWLIDNGFLDKAEAKKIESGAARIVASAVRFARTSSDPDPDAMCRGLFA